MSITSPCTSADFLLDIVGTQTMGNETTSVETHCPCTLSRRNHKIYIQYIEEDVSRLVTIDGTHVQLRALGDLASRLEFDCSAATSGEYHTPYGTISMQVITHTLTVSDEPESSGTLRLYMEYDLEMNGEPVSQNKLELVVNQRSLHTK